MKCRKKILYVCCNFTWGGVEQYIINIIDFIDKSKFQIDILLPDKDRYERENDLENRAVNILRYKTSSVQEKISNFYKIVTVNQYDIIHFHTGHESALLCLIAKAAGCNGIIVHAHTSFSGDENLELLHLFKKKIIFKLSEFIYRYTAQCFACSADAARFMFGKSNANIEILKNGIHIKKFQISHIPQSEYSLCINARFDASKNPFFVIEVLYELVQLESQISLEWVGTGPMRTEIERRIKMLHLENNITLLGPLYNVEDVLLRNKFFFLPSIYEGLGIALIEAQAAGLKCFISDAIPDEVDCGGCMKISLVNSPKEWAEIMLREMLKSKEPNINKKQLDKFGIATTVKTLEEIYEGMV